ncbi:MAG: hypothetical protein JW818_00710 [Pirellulales bacterium]|nr:hypothetical protein [Pirellulales bacterium]
MTDDTTIGAFEAELRSVDRRFNTMLFVFLGIAVPLSLLYERSSLKAGILDLFLIVLFGSVLFGLVIALAKAKARTYRKYSLLCPHCGKTPYALLAVTAMRTGICPRCKKEMSAQQMQPEATSETAPSAVSETSDV